MSEKIVLGLSGGVDSAEAAGLLRARGFEVHGVFLRHGALDPAAAVRAAAELDIPLEIIDISERLERNVCRRFESEYLAGRTPNPCAICNPTVKFPELIEAADRIGAHFVATGHYARTERREGYTALLRARCQNDQSYMLCRLPQDIITRCIFPLGELDKEQVRGLAQRDGLSAASAPDSMEICFIPDGDYGAWLEARGAHALPGDFLSEDGETLGRHEGLYRYTVGKRRGLRYSAGERMYVKAIRADTNSIILAKESEMYTQSFEIHDVMRLAPHNVLPAGKPFRAQIKVRHSRVSYPCEVAAPENGSAQARTDEAIRIPAPGQYAAVYISDELVLSGTI